MARIFISHSGRDNDAAARMKAWLASQGFENGFLDKDKTTGIPPGADWEKTLYREVDQSQAVIILQTPAWLASKWCFAEFTQARALGKAIFPVIETPADGERIAPDIQALNLTSDRDAGLGRLKRELVRIALDAQGGFAWDASRPPFPGLLAFQEEDAAIYFGRDDDIRRLIERLEARRAQGGIKLIALLGSSGSGKSSLLRAGVIPRLKRAGRNWIVVPPMRPGPHPVDALAVALAAAKGPGADWRKLKEDLLGPDPRRAFADFASDLRVKGGSGEAQVLIPIDQAEELFGVADPDEARRFLEILSQAMFEILPFLAVMAMRSDFLGQLQSVASLTARFEEFSLGPMPLARVPQIMEGPARVAGLSVEDAFVQQAARDGETEDALPLLAFALRELLDRSSNKALTLDGYKALGDKKAGLTPLENAVRQAADRVLAEAKPADDELMALREAFVPAMVRVNDEGEYVRRPARLDELPIKARPLLRRLENARLISRPKDDAHSVEVAHEALLRKWPLLRSWLDAARGFLIGKRQLEHDLQVWEEVPKEDEGRALLTGLKLDRSRGWLVEYPTQLTDKERAFIEASVRYADADKRRKEQLRRDAIANESRALTALSQAASLQGHYTDAVKLALAAWPRSAADERPMLSRTIDALAQALSGPLEVLPPLRHYGPVNSVAFSPDGRRMVTASDDTTVRLWDAATGKPIGQPLQHDGPVNSAAFSSNGAWVVTTSGNAALVWDTATGALVAQPLQHEGSDSVTSAAFSPNGAWVVTTSHDAWMVTTSDKAALVWDAATGALVAQTLQHEGPVNSAAFSPDGARVVTASADKTARLWDVTSGAPIGKAMRHKDIVTSAAFSPDGARVATASGDKTARLWDAATGAAIGKAMRHKDNVTSAVFSRDGKRLATVSNDKTVRLWDAATRSAIGKPLQHEDNVRSAAFSSDGARVVTASWDGTARIWDAATGVPVCKPLPHQGSVNCAAFSPDGVFVATASNDKAARVWDAATGVLIGSPLQHESSVTSASFSHDSALVVTTSLDDAARVWDAATGALIGKPMQHDDFVRSAAFSPDGTLLTTACDDKTGRVWDTATGAPIGQPLQHEGCVNSAAFSRDGGRVVTASNDKTARMWDTATGVPIGKPFWHDGSVFMAAFSPDGARLVTASDDSTARVWDVATGTLVGRAFQHDAPVRRAAFSPDGARVVTASDDTTARVWDAATGILGQSLRHKGCVSSAVFSPDGTRVVTASNDTTAVWDALNGAPIGQPMQHAHIVAGAAFSGDGARVVSASWDKTARVWDAATGAPIGQPLQHDGPVNSAAFSSNGAWVLTASRDNTARLWNAPPVAPSIVATACKMLRDHDTAAGLFTRYGIDVKDPICTGDAPAPDPSRMIDR